MSKLPRSFYLENDVVLLAKKLIGKKLCTHFNGQLTTGLITETEAYAGVTDKASHAYGGRHTKRTKTMYAQGGTAYVYLCYGIHHLFNVVTNLEGVPHAVLIRGIKPIDGVELMKTRRNISSLNNLSNGPGKVAKALGISTQNDGIDLLSNEIWIEEGVAVDEKEIEATPRIGIDYAEEHKDLPWRFVWKEPNH